MNGRSDLEELQLVIFTVGETEFGIHISAVREIIAPSKLVSLPSMPPSMVGITNVRGTVLPIVDLKSRFAMGCSQLEEYESQKILLMEIGGSMVGYLVDAVSEVLRIPVHSLRQSKLRKQCRQ
ncbi:MAG: chemotaxis protein CheW [Bacillota bacterium]|jgi:purine-binding chemotaxis protein CheW|nr:chemotaxis protein CheW [Bacillota bacterium]